MATDYHAKTGKFRKGSKLEIFLDRKGVTIMGNKYGLLSFAELIRRLAKKPVWAHEHVGFHWSHDILDGNLIIGLGKTILAPPTKTVDGSGRDLTVMVAPSIGKQFWKKVGKQPPYSKKTKMKNNIYSKVKNEHLKKKK